MSKDEKMKMEKFAEIMCQWNTHKLKPERALSKIWVLFGDDILPYWRREYCKDLEE